MVRTTIELDKELWLKVKQSGLGYKDLIRLGLKALEERREEHKLLAELRKRVTQLENENARLRERYFEIKRMLEEFKGVENAR